jgi:hypothetical protein
MSKISAVSLDLARAGSRGGQVRSRPLHDRLILLSLFEI